MGATADPSLFPTEDFRACLEDVFRELGADALEYGPPEGFGPLREWVAELLGARGVAVDPDQVFIVSGSQQGLDLISRLLVREGDSVLVEEPGYTNGFRLFQANGARAVGVELDGGGLRLDALAAQVEGRGARLLYTMPVFQNPTGTCLAEDRRGTLLDLCARHALPIVEDQFDADLSYDGEPPRPLKSMDERDQVVLLGSFSKILFPGLRLGWMAVPRPLLAPLRELKQMSDLSSGLLSQCAMNLFCRRGLLARHLTRVRQVYGGRLSVMLESLEREFPSGTRWTRPRGGLTLWVTLPPGSDTWELLQAARREGVEFSPGALFFPGGGGSEHLRLSWIRESEERIRRGIALLGSLVANQKPSAGVLTAPGPFF
jgi:2-aminoadipate transaminase